MQKAVRLLLSRPFVITLWFGLSLFAVGKSVLLGHSHIHNNYFVYKYNFYHVIHQQNLYACYPAQYFDMNHYGPIFAYIIGPFALMPDAAGVVLWVMFTAGMLLLAIQKLPVKEDNKRIIILLCAHELMTSAANVQINPLIAALILFSYIFIKNGNDFWAALMIALGTFIKLYGIVAIAFFFFSNNKLKLIGSFVLWSAVLFVLPMLISSPSFIIQTYHDWFKDLQGKNLTNIASTREDVSVMGMARKMAFPNMSNLVVLIPGIVLFALSYIRTNLFNNLNYQLLIVASTLIFPVIFSTGSESPTYIIAFVGVAIWFINAERPFSKLDIGLIIFAFILTSLSPSDLFPRYLKDHYVMPYALKALPCFLIWLKIIYEALFRKITNDHLIAQTA
ncbi:glycosyltransferase family 87 protein [Mucilaginibacter ximonensis]|uniref:Glycosyltransferase family 87 protein n=1 Tax=Mucilaginibacter ximonensis TaxID=538021 RepID=A0ABW5Y9F2_9SPHI